MVSKHERNWMEILMGPGESQKYTLGSHREVKAEYRKKEPRCGAQEFIWIPGWRTSGPWRRLNWQIKPKSGV